MLERFLLYDMNIEKTRNGLYEFLGKFEIRLRLSNAIYIFLFSFCKLLETLNKIIYFFLFISKYFFL